jgi:hypothetical protein
MQIAKWLIHLSRFSSHLGAIMAGLQRRLGEVEILNLWGADYLQPAIACIDNQLAAGWKFLFLIFSSRLYPTNARQMIKVEKASRGFGRMHLSGSHFGTVE